MYRSTINIDLMIKGKVVGGGKKTRDRRCIWPSYMPWAVCLIPAGGSVRHECNDGYVWRRSIDNYQMQLRSFELRRRQKHPQTSTSKQPK